MNNAEANTAALSPGTELLRGQYKIIHPIGQGGFGLTYLAQDSLKRNVVIKECFPEQMCRRIGVAVHPTEAQDAHYFHAVLEQFQEEALRLAELDHPGIVSVHQTFAENGTAYTAMDFVEGVDLLDVVEQSPGKLTKKTIDSVLRQTLDALRYLHDRNILHRDIAPDNLILGDNGQVTLIDFGAAYASNECGTGNKQPMLAVKDGYSPPEFYLPDEIQGAFSDMYSFGALCHLMFAETPPPDALTRTECFENGQNDPYQNLEHSGLEVDIRLLLATDRALSLDPADRLNSVDDWFAIIDGPIPKPLAEFDPTVLGTIKELVNDTNRLVQRGVPRSLRPPPPLSPASQVVPKQYVDLFGNPIDDVDAYLAEQDKISTADRTRKTRERPRNDNSTKNKREKEPKSGHAKATLFQRFRGRFNARREDSQTRILQT